MDVVQLVKDGKGIFEWSEVVSEHNGYKLYIKVFRDAMKFDNIEACTWNLKPLQSWEADHGKIFNGVRLPATAHQLQQIADMLNCMMLTPKVIDLIWLQAEIKFNCIVNINGNIVAVSHVTDVHKKIEEKIQTAGNNGLVSCVGKYWCLINDLKGRPNLHGDKVACNYGWFASNASGPGITPGTKCWQRPGFRHNKQHFDPSQTIRLMYRMAKLIHPNGTEEEIDLHGVATDSSLAPLMHHQGVLTYLRQDGVPKLIPVDPYPPSEPEPEPIEPEPESEPIPLDKPKEDKKEGGKAGLFATIIAFILKLFR